MANICSTDIYITGEHSEITALCKELWPASKVGWGVVDFLDLPTRFTYDEGEGCEITYMEEGEGECRLTVESKWSEVTWPFFMLAWEHPTLDVKFTAFEPGMGYYVTNDISGETCGGKYVVQGFVYGEDLKRLGSQLPEIPQDMEIEQEVLNDGDLDEICMRYVGLPYEKAMLISESNNSSFSLDEISCVERESWNKLKLYATACGKFIRAFNATRFPQEKRYIRKRVYSLEESDLKILLRDLEAGNVKRTKCTLEMVQI